MKIDTRIARFLSPLELQALGSDVIDARGMSTIPTETNSRAQAPSSISVPGARADIVPSFLIELTAGIHDCVTAVEFGSQGVIVNSRN